MKEHSILMSAPMVRAILAGTKTQTRRQCKGWALHWLRDAGFLPGFVALRENNVSRYGYAGDRLWVRETWAPLTKGYAYRADPIWNAPPADRWHPSIHMPRVASRITLEITELRVERLHDISESDARAEGSPCIDEVSGREVLFPDASKCGTFKLGYRYLWETINGPGSWDANPWVWAISFKVV
jgi:hypothetical protein